MSESTPPDTPSPTPAPGASKPNRTRAQKWRRRILVTLIVLLGVVIFIRVMVVVLLPSVLQKIAGQYGLTCTYDHSDMYLIDSDVGLWHLTIAPKEGGEPLFKAEYCRGDIAALPLLRGKLVVRRAEADGIDLLLERVADGSIPILKHLPQTTTTAAPAANTKPQPLDLTPPIKVDIFLLQQVRVHLRDPLLKPALDTEIEMNMRLTGVGSQTEPTRFVMDLNSEPILDALRIEGQATTQNNALDAQLKLNLTGLHLRPLDGYLRLAGLRAAAEGISMRLDAKVHAAPGARPGSLAAGLSFDNVNAIADGIRFFGLEHFAVDASSLDESTAEFSKLSISGVRFDAERDADGGIHFAGASWNPNQPPAAQTPPLALPPAAPKTGPAPKPISVSLAALEIKDVQAAFHDRYLTPPADLSIVVDELTAASPMAGGKTNEMGTVSARLSAPGLIKRIALDGKGNFGGKQQTAEMKVQADGINPAALRPYLDAIGLESLLHNASFGCEAHAVIAPGGSLAISDAKLDHVVLRDEGKDLFSLAGVHIADAGLDLPNHRVHVATLEISGPRLAARRESSGALNLLGFRTRVAQAPKSEPLAKEAPATAPLQVATASEESPPILPRVEVGHFAWKDVGFSFDDAFAKPPVSVALKDALVEVDNLIVDPNSKIAGVPAKLNAWLTAPGLAERLSAQGTITPEPGGASLAVDVRGTKLSGDAIAPTLKALGIEPLIHNASLELHATAGVKDSARGLGATLDVNELKFQDGEHELFGLDGFGVHDVVLGPKEMSVGEVSVHKPRSSVARQEDGTLVIAGIHLLPPPPKPPGPITVGELGPDPLAALLQALSANSSYPATVKKISLDGAAIAWSDRSVKPAVQTTAHAGASLTDLVFGRAAPAAKLEAHFAADGILDSLTATGAISTSPIAPGIHLDIKTTGIQAGPVNAYLPPGIRLELKDGRFTSSIDAAIAPEPKGGENAQLTVGATELRDGDQESPLLKIDGAKVLLTRLDLTHCIMAFDEVSLTGLETEIRKSKDGTLKACGVAIAPASEATTEPSATATQPTPATVPAAAPSVAVAPAPALASAEARTTMPSAAQVLQKLPLIKLARLNLNLKKASYTDEGRPGSDPLVLSEIVLKNRQPIELLGDDPESHTPVQLQITGAIQPAISSINCNIDVAPLVARPTLVIELAAAGIRGDSVTALFPELKDQLDGANLQDGQFHAHFDGQAKLVPVHPVGFDFSRPMGGEFVLNQVAFKDKPDGSVLLGVDEVRSDGIRFDPTSGNIEIRSIEITKPIGSALREKNGLHIAGIVLKLPPELMAFGMPDTQPSAKKEPPPKPAPDTQPTDKKESSTAVASAKPAHEIRIDKLTITGADLVFQDHVMVPPLVLPITSLDLEARDLSNMAQYEDKPFRFSLTASAGKTALPSLKRGAPADATEQRELFAQATASGNLSLYPAPKGWAKSSLSALDLSGFRGVAHALGITLNSGNLDTNTDLRFPGDGTAQTSTKIVFTDLSIDEPPNGPIQKALQLPISLDPAIKALQDPDGGITIPISVQVAKGKIDGLGGQMVGAVASVVLTAIASAPVKAVNVLGDVLGLGGKQGKNAIPPVDLGFAGGDAVLSASDAASLSGVIEKLKKDKTLEVTVRHELGNGDVTRAAIRANPTPEECEVLAANLRRKKEQLLAIRAAVSGSARGELASWSSTQTQPAVARLRQIDLELAQTEEGLDRLYDLLRPGADRQAPRRTRAACLEIGRQRLEAVRAYLLASGIPGIDQRIHLTHATYNPSDDQEGGDVTLVITKKKG